VAPAPARRGGAASRPDTPTFVPEATATPMGARLAKQAGASRRVAVEDRFTKPSGLYVHRNIDGGKLKSLILQGKLSPCHPGVEEPGPGEALEECPICFLVRACRVRRARDAALAPAWALGDLL
jgi:hypothetical protein